MTDKKLNLTKYIYEYLPIIKQVFKDFYGEKYSSLIEERLNNATYIGYAFPKDIKITLNRLYKEQTEKLIIQFFKENNIECTENNIRKYFQYSPNFKFCESNRLHIIFSYLEKEEHSNMEEITFLNNLKMISNNNQLEKDSSEYKNIIQELEKLHDSFKIMLDEFKKFQSQYQIYDDYISSCEKLSKQIHEKYNIIFLHQISEYLSEHDKKKIDNQKNNIDISNLECYNILIKSSYQCPTLIDAFTTESEKKLEDPLNYTKNSIIKDRISYFKKIGIDLGDDYNNYINNPICKVKMPSKEMADKIIQLRESLYQQEQEEYITSTTMYQEQLDKINKLGLLNKENNYNYSNLSNNLTCIDPNIVRENDTYKIYSLLLFSINSPNDYFDERLIHELNHLIELSTLEVNEDEYRILCGFDELIQHFPNSSNNNKENTENRDFELLNEIINELIAQEVTELMHNQGIYLFDNKETAKIKNGTNYERTKIIVEDFYQTYKEDIIEARLTGNLNKLFSKIGYDNIINLNKLVNDYMEHFAGFNYYRLINDKKAGKDTEDIQYYKKCIEERNKIFQKMEEQSIQKFNNISK